MKSKTKFFSILIFGLLALPIVFYSPDNGQVLGVSETNTNNISSINSISSGVRDTAETDKQVNNKYGKIILDAEQKVPISTNKYSLGSSVIIKTGNQEVVAVINQINPSLPDDVVLSLDQETYDKFNKNTEFFEAEIIKQ